MKKFFMAVAIFIMGSQAPIEARQPYEAQITVSNESVDVFASNLQNLENELQTAAIQKLLPIYTSTSAASIGINLRGLIGIGSFAAGSSSFEFILPNAGIAITFDGTTREDSISLFHSYIYNGGNGKKLFRAYAKHSPIDPIAGNPNSLLAQMAQSDYLLGRLSPLSGCDCCWSAQPIVHQFQAGINFERAFSHGYDTTAFLLPLRYSYSPNLNWALIIDCPITLIDNGGAYSLYSSLGFGLRFPITSNWSLTPSLRAGFGGSLDLATASSFVMTGVNSTYNLPIYDYVLSMTNYAGYYTSTNLYLGGINFDYHLYNFVFKNGLNFSSCEGFEVCGRDLNFNLSFIDSAFSGHRLYIQHYDEVGIAVFTTGVNPCLDYDCLSLGFAYQFGQKSFKGYNVNLTYQF